MRGFDRDFFWDSHIEEIRRTLRLFSATDSLGQDISPDQAFERWKEHTLAIRENRKTIYLIGNGASASMASHISADLAKNAQIHTEVFSDLSLITAVANDLSFEQVFAEPLRRRMAEGDLLVAISSSGQSPNVLNAAREAMLRGGLVITLSAMRPDNLLRSSGMLNFYIPAARYGLAETCHAAVLHYWIDLVVGELHLRAKRQERAPVLEMMK